MSETTTDRCGYVWPKNHEIGDSPRNQSCCWRQTSESAEYCPWHVETKEKSKSIEALLKTRAQKSIREQNANYAELLDGADLSGLVINDEICFEDVALRSSNFSDTNLKKSNFSDSDLEHTDLSNANLNSADLSNASLICAELNNAELRDSLFRGSNLSAAELTETDLKNANLRNAYITGSKLTHAYLEEADCRGANFAGSNLNKSDLLMADFRESAFQGASLCEADLAGANLKGADLRETDLVRSKLPSANLEQADLRYADLREANLRDADLPEADLRGAEIQKVEGREVDFNHANLANADFTDANLQSSNLADANMEHAILIRTNLFSADLTDSLPHGATFTDVQINDDTEIQSVNQQETNRKMWQRGPLAPAQRCGYDPVQFKSWTNYIPGINLLQKTCFSNSDNNTNQLGKAADTYQTFEKLARENARPTLQSQMFVLRQDMQRKRHWFNQDYLNWGFARVSRALFKYGESLGRIAGSASLIIILYGFFYYRFNLVTNSDGFFVGDLVDAIYFSTLTFTSLGLGDFKPNPGSEIARLLVTSQSAMGAILISIFVFVLGRRAAK